MDAWSRVYNSIYPSSIDLFLSNQEEKCNKEELWITTLEVTAYNLTKKLCKHAEFCISVKWVFNPYQQRDVEQFIDE